MIQDGGPNNALDNSWILGNTLLLCQVIIFFPRTFAHYISAAG